MEIIRSVLPVITMLLIGMLIHKKNIISEEGIKGLQALVMNVTLPLGLFGTFYKTSLTADQFILPLTMFILVSGGIFFSRLLGKAFRQTDPYMPFMASGYEFGMLGYALIAILAGSENITSFAIMDLGHSLAIFTVYIAMLKGIGGEKQTAGQVVKGLLSTPVLVAILAGTLIGVTGLGRLLVKCGAGSIIDSVCSFASAPTSAAILVVIGYRMNFRGLDVKRVAGVCAVRIVMQLVFVIAVLTVFRLIGGACAEELTTMSFILALILPPPFILPLYIENTEQKEFYSLSISAFTLLSVIAFIVMVAVYA